MNSRWNGQFLRSFWSREKKSRKLAGTSRHPNVTTSQRRDVKSTRRGSQQVANVVTPQRRDVAKSRRLNVATLQRRYVNAIFASPSLKAKGIRFRGHRKTHGRGHGKQSSRNQIGGEDSWICIFFFSKRMLMFYGLIMCITKSRMF